MSRDSRKLWICLARRSPFCLCHFHLLLTKLSCQNIQTRNVSCLDQFLAALVSAGLCETCLWQVKVIPAGVELPVYLPMAASCPQPHGQPPALVEPSAELGHPWPLCTPCPPNTKASRRSWKAKAATQRFLGREDAHHPPPTQPTAQAAPISPGHQGHHHFTFQEAQSPAPVFLATPGQRQN